MKGGDTMPRKYDNNFKSMIINLIINEKHSTIKTAEQFDIPLKTVEKWITAYNKNNRIFDAEYKSQAQIIDDLIECNSPQISGRNIESEKEALTHRIKAFKENNDFPELYENILTIRTGLSKHILEKYNGRKFRKEAIEDILAPVSDRVEAAIASNVKSLGSAIKPIDFGNEN